jgi:hypothetical protein
VRPSGSSSTPSGADNGTGTTWMPPVASSTRLQFTANRSRWPACSSSARMAADTVSEGLSFAR